MIGMFYGLAIATFSSLVVEWKYQHENQDNPIDFHDIRWKAINMIAEYALKLQKFRNARYMDDH